MQESVVSGVSAVSAVSGPRRMLLGGDLVDSASGETIAVQNPANRSIFAHVPRAGAEDVDRAVNAAAGAFPNWRDVPPRDRGRMLLRIADAVEAKTEELARTIAAETGNALRTQARGEAGTDRGHLPLLRRPREVSSRARPCRSASTC